MPAKARHLRNRAENFVKGAKTGVKRVIISLSPHKKRKTAEDDRSEKENFPGKTSTSPSAISVDPPLTDPIEDVILASADNLAHRLLTFSTLEEVPDEDDISYLASAHPNPSTDSLDSITPTGTDPEQAAFEKAAAADPASQDVYSRVYDVYVGPGKLREAPTIFQATTAAKDLTALLRGEKCRECSAGYKDPGIDPFCRKCMEGMQIFLNFYTDPRSKTYGHWGASALQTTVALGRSQYCMRGLCQLARQFIHDRSLLPVNPFGDWNKSLLVNEGLATDINLYLQEIGNQITAEKVVVFPSRPEIMEKHGITRVISVHTARRYLRALGYRYMEPKKGQYTDGHEREDVVHERDNVYIPKIKSLEARMHHWDRDGCPEFRPHPKGKRVVVWYHNESIFYAHDQKHKGWYHKDASKLHKKGDGHSLMVADFVSVDFGWSPTSLDGKRTARRFMKPAKDRDGYFTCQDITDQAEEFMDILDEVYPDFEHHFVYDNATTHKKCADGALSARKMPKGPMHDKNFMVSVNAHGADGKQIYMTSGKKQKTQVPMHGAEFNGQPQPLYFPAGHKHEGVFKGMKIILEERGLADITKKRAECLGFKCVPPAVDCCCRRALFNQPDFANVPLLLETACDARGYGVLFLPKFHCELNFI
ncbi:hypothetical protein DFH08DRAFT_956188 [Mycena albidolilacea]|uniref:Uncharacterized protein n=1 Tax=Mycena albidolilacea TaxID=1033008 RepID=A0AAD7A9Z3_9AGAR|nr:hypothetical protein DFH08DRAFT_956188 [Mycena albidolilacea]